MDCTKCGNLALSKECTQTACLGALVSLYCQIYEPLHSTTFGFHPIGKFPVMPFACFPSQICLMNLLKRNKTASRTIQWKPSLAERFILFTDRSKWKVISKYQKSNYTFCINLKQLLIALEKKRKKKEGETHMWLLLLTWT